MIAFKFAKAKPAKKRELGGAAGLFDGGLDAEQPSAASSAPPEPGVVPGRAAELAAALSEGHAAGHAAAGHAAAEHAAAGHTAAEGGGSAALGEGAALGESVALGSQVRRRGEYTFCRRYTTGRLKRVGECEGLQSIDAYENLGLVGKGAFNKIYRAKHRASGEVVALKAMQLKSLEESHQMSSSEGIPLEMVREMSILMSIRHPNIVAVREAVVDQSQMFMVMELVDFDLGLLIEHMKQPFTEAQVKCLAMQLLSALAAAHECFVLHRDLKQTNLLLDRNGVLKLCDFGLARRCGASTVCTPDVTSLWYRAPEILLGERRYGSAVDIWSFGCIFAEWLQLGKRRAARTRARPVLFSTAPGVRPALAAKPCLARLSGEPLFQGSSEVDQINAIFRCLGTPSEHSWPSFGQLRAVQTAVFPFVENFDMKLGADGALVRLPKNSLRRKFPAVGCARIAVPRKAQHEPRPSHALPSLPAPRSYTPAAAQLNQFRTTALSDAGFVLLNSALACDPAQRVSAAAALEHSWFSAEPLPAPLSRVEIRQLRRNRDEAISSGAHQLAIAQQHLRRVAANLNKAT